MGDVLGKLGEGLWNAFLMAWEVWWALVLGFLISAIVQAWVPRERIESALSGNGAGPVARATVLGAASSSCSYAAIAIAKTLFQKGASAVSALAFQFASTNLVWELGLVLWILIGWQFALAEYVGGVLMIGLMWALLRLFVSRQAEQDARAHAREAHTRHQHHPAGEGDRSWRDRLTSMSAWSDVAHNFRGDWQMLWKEITISFLCSVGNVPLAAVLWSGGISFAGVMAFIFADLIVLPILAAYRKYYGWSFALRITALMFVTMVLAALAVDLVFGGLSLIPSSRPTTEDVFGSIEADYKLALNAVGLVIFAALLVMTMRRGATDPVCGMKVDRGKALVAQHHGQTFHFCSEHCRASFEAAPGEFSDRGERSPQLSQAH